MRGAGLGFVVGGLVVLVAVGPFETLFIAPALTLAALVIAVARAGRVVVCGEGDANEDPLQDRAEKLGRGAMNTAKDHGAGITETRASSLRLKDSGVFRRLHGGQSSDRPGNDQSLNDAPVQVGQSGGFPMSALDRAVPRLLDNSLQADGLASIDAAAVCNKQRQYVDEWRKPGGAKAVSGVDLLKVCSISGSLRAVVRDLLDQMEARAR